MHRQVLGFDMHQRIAVHRLVVLQFLLGQIKLASDVCLSMTIQAVYQYR